MKNFSEFAELGNLQRYSLSQLISIVKSMKLTEEVTDTSIIATWEDDSALFVVEYDLNGKFVKILKQHYKIITLSKLLDRFNFLRNRSIKGLN